MSFDDLLAANRSYAAHFSLTQFDGLAHAGVAMVTCMDSRLEPLEMIGLKCGDAKFLRTPGGHVTEDALKGCILGVHLLRVKRILIVPHTRCAMASGTDDQIRENIFRASGLDASGVNFGADPDQFKRLDYDVSLVRDHPLIKGRAEVGGFMYDVDSGLLTQHC